jgi:hypothetical protein
VVVHKETLCSNYLHSKIGFFKKNCTHNHNFEEELLVRQKISNSVKRKAQEVISVLSDQDTERSSGVSKGQFSCLACIFVLCLDRMRTCIFKERLADFT